MNEIRRDPNTNCKGTITLMEKYFFLLLIWHAVVCITGFKNLILQYVLNFITY